MRFSHIVAITWGLALPSSVLATETPAAMTSAARQILTKRMVDPASLQLRNTRIITIDSPTGQPVPVLCGEYNAKNRMGGYSGFKTFAYEPADLRGLVTLHPDASFDYFSADGSGDLGHDAEADTVTPPAVWLARQERTLPFVLKYVPACVGRS